MPDCMHICMYLADAVEAKCKTMAQDLHVVMLPWAAFGHLIPFFQLSTALAKAGVKVSFVSTPRNIQRLPPFPPTLSELINLVEFQFPTLNNEILPTGAEATVDIPADKIQYLKLAYDLLQHPFKQFVADQKPNWIIVDLIPHWAVDVAGEYRVPLLHFSVFSAATYAFYRPAECLASDGRTRFWQSWQRMTVRPEWIDFPSSVAYRDHEAAVMYEAFYGGNASGISDAERFYKTFNSCQAFAIRSCPEIEVEYFDLYRKLTAEPVIPVGLLPPERPKVTEKVPDGPWGEIFRWLDGQKPKSVVFVGFGSEYKLSKDQVYEIAYGLEMSELPFLWALRRPNWAVDDVDAFPSGFAERTSQRGVVCLGWAPQLEIVAHPSIGGSLFHSGWGSLIEMLQFGHCLVLLPFIIDQPLNARLLVEKGLGVEVERGEDGSFSRDAISKALRVAMVSEVGQDLRNRAREAAEIFGNHKLHDEYIDKFVEFLIRNKHCLREGASGCS